MAFDTLTKAIRLLIGRRYTSTDLTDSQEAFASTIQMGSSEIWSQTNLIPSASLPYSSSVTPGTTTTTGVIKYWYKWPLTVANNTVTGSSVWYFTSPTGSVSGIGSQLIDGGQQTNFISPKYVTDSNIVNQSADADNNGNPPGYNIALFTSTNGVTFTPLSPSASYQFDYKNGILQFTTTVVPNNRVYATAYQYVGRMISDPNDIVTLSITASNISASGFISSSILNVTSNIVDEGNLTVLGNTTLGDSINDTVQITGSVNVSGSFTLSGSATLSDLTANRVVYTDNNKVLSTDDDLIFDGNTLTVTNVYNTNLTSSYISSSGFITGSSLNIVGNSVLNTITGSLSGSQIFTGNATIEGGTINNTPIGSTTPSTGNFTNLSSSTIYNTGQLTTLGNTTIGDSISDVIQITGSIGISGSFDLSGSTKLSDLTANRVVYTDNNKVLSTDNDLIFDGNTLTVTNIYNTNLTSSYISASGFVSSSTIYDSGTLVVIGNSTLSNVYAVDITASNISASGNISGSNIWNQGSLTVLGNSKLGDSVSDTIQITGSTNISGSLTVTGLTTLETLNLNNISASGWVTASSLNIVGNSVLNTITGSLSGSSISTGNAIINGGFINNTPIGNVTPSTGIFTNITASNISASTFTSSIQNGVGFFGTSSWSVSSSYSDYAATAGLSQNAQDILVYVKNTSGAIIPKGKVVRITGADNSANFGTIGLADWINDNNSANTLGFTNESFSINGFGYVMTEGYLTGVDTGDFTSGDLLYLSSSGTYTNIVPIAPKHGVRLGQAIRSQQNNGSIYVRIDNGAELGELHDVIDSTTTSSYGDLLIKSGSVWVNSKNLTGSYTLTGSLSGNTASFNTLIVTGNSTLNTVTASNISASGNITGNSLTVTGNSLFYGDLTVYGSSSIVNISSSTVIIGDNRIQLNAWSTGSFSQRYAGLDLTDSGSSNTVTSSLLWDSLNNYWVLTNNQTGSNPVVTSSALILQGPLSNFGSEKQLSQNNFLKVETAIGNLTSSNLYEINDVLKYNGTISASVVSSSNAYISSDLVINGILKVFDKIYAYAGLIGDVTGSLSGSSVTTKNLSASTGSITNLSSSIISSSYAYFDTEVLINGILKVYNKIYAYGGVVGDVTGSLSGSYVLVTNITSSNITSSTIVSSNNYLVNVTSSNISSSNIVTNTLTSSIILGTNITSSNISASGYISSSNIYVENTLVADTGSFIYFNINNSGSAPTNINASGMPGEIRFDNNFIYIYTRNRWVRSPIVEWD